MPAVELRENVSHRGLSKKYESSLYIGMAMV